MSSNSELKILAINTLRFLSADAVQAANSGHPGLPMGAAAMAFVLWTRHLKFNPRNPKWPDRDRFILSGGHGSMLLYSLLYLTGYDVSLDEIKNFRQWGSITPGHPEAQLTPGVEVTTGPLGQGFANGVGMAIAAQHLAEEFNKPGFEIIDHNIYAIVTDGDLMEGVASEAASLAGHLKLGRLIYLYDNNYVSIDGSTELAFSENREARFEAYGWHVQKVGDGNDLEQIDEALEIAKSDERPSLISIRTKIGYGLPNLEGTSKAHGEPPGDAELDAAKRNLGWPVTPRFYIPDNVSDFFRQSIQKGEQAEKDWMTLLSDYKSSHPDLYSEFRRRMDKKLPEKWFNNLPDFPSDEKGMATRNSSGKVINAIANVLPELLGGSADLTPSNKTWIDSSTSIQADNFMGRNIHFGVREHAMGGIVNGLASHGGIIPYGGTFLVFSDYMRPAIRLSALSGYHSIWVFTHDSIGLGEDGPTHQPIEQLSSLRAVPGLVVVRPADANEVSEAWKIAIERRDGPTAIVLTRQNVPTLDRKKFASSSGARKGAYVLVDLGENRPEIILMASGSEVSLIVEAGKRLANTGINVRIVSFPSWELFNMQDQKYKDSVLSPEVKKRISVEAGVGLGWERWVGDQGKMISIEGYGASAPYKTILEKFGFSADKIINLAESLVYER